MTQDLNRIRQLAGVPLMEADQHTWTPSQDELQAERDADEERQLAALDARADVEAQIERNIKYAFEKVGLELSSGHNLYFDDETTMEAKVDYDVNGIPFETLMALAKSGLGRNFSIAPQGDFLIIRFTIDENLAAGSPID